jgi:hypothetical protein
LRRDGILVFKAEIAAGASPHSNFFDAGLLGKDGLTARLAAFTELVADGGFDPRLSRATVDRTWPQDGPRSGEAYFLTLQDGRILIPNLWFLRRRETASRYNWETCPAGCSSVGSANRSNTACRRRRSTRRRGPYRNRPWSRRACVFRSVPRCAERPVPVSVGMRLSPGVRYRDASGAVLEVAAGRTILANQPFDRSSIKSGVLTMEFTVSPEQAARGDALEIRVCSPSNFAASFASVDLRASETVRLYAPPV